MSVDVFRRLSNWTAERVGSPAAFALGLMVVVVWGLSGPLFHYSDTWQLVINTGTTIVTFLMVFLIQNTQNREARAMQIKLNELIRAVSSARNAMVDLESCSDDEIAHLQAEFTKLRLKRQQRELSKGKRT